MRLKKNSLVKLAVTILLVIAVFDAQNAAAQMLTGYSKQMNIAEARDKLPLAHEQKPATNYLTSHRTQNILDVRFVDDFSVEEEASSPDKQASPVNFQADNLSHDDKNNIITASGDVMLEQEGRILRADKIVYDLNKDIVVASGHVVLNEVSGDIFYSEEVTLQNSMKDGLITTLHTYLEDGSRFIAETARRKDGTKTIMEGVVFIPCKICESGETPAWQIRASKVTHDKESKTISYNNARFEFFGVPVAYAPYFSHPDGSVKQKSGILAPIIGYKSRLGAQVNSRYYWAIAPDHDATIGVTAFTKQAPMLTGEYRSRWKSASLKLSGAVTYSERKEDDAGIKVVKDEDFRGHFFAQGLWNINNKWRAGTNLALASDDQYMRQYDFSSEDVLENEIYAERFEGRNYASGRLIAFQDTRVRDEQVDQPTILPELIVSFKGDPSSVPVLGGNWSIDSSYLGLRREGQKQDVDRYSAQVGWDRRLISTYGFLTSVSATMRGDIYQINDSEVSTTNSSDTESRFFPQISAQGSYPVVRNFQTTQMTIEPLIAFTAAPNLDVNEDIPNEDSQDVQIDASNIFEANRFPGYDRFEDKSRITYGMRTGLYGAEGSYGNFFLGQSYRFDEGNNPFPAGSGLNKQSSDVVGQVSGSYKENYLFDYRFQLESDNLSSQRHEIDAQIYQDRFTMGVNYLFAKALEGTNINESREQVGSDVAYYLGEEWRARVGAIQDFGDNPGLREAYLGLDYFGDCLSWALTGKRNLTDDSSGESSTEIFFTLGLKNLGEFEQSTYKKSNNQACGIIAP